MQERRTHTDLWSDEAGVGFIGLFWVLSGRQHMYVGEE